MGGGGCGVHVLCAYRGDEPGLCPGCHASWAVIEAPAEERWVLGNRMREGKTVAVVDIRYLGGRGETREEHAARHEKRQRAGRAGEEGGIVVLTNQEQGSRK